MPHFLRQDVQQGIVRKGGTMFWQQHAKEMAAYKESMLATGTFYFRIIKPFFYIKWLFPCGQQLTSCQILVGGGAPCNPQSEITKIVAEILGMAIPSICGIVDAPDPALLKLKELKRW